MSNEKNRDDVHLAFVNSMKHEGSFTARGDRMSDVSRHGRMHSTLHKGHFHSIIGSWGHRSSHHTARYYTAVEVSHILIVGWQCVGDLQE